MKHMLCVATQLKYHLFEMEEADWDDKEEKRLFHKRQAEHYKKLSEEGVLYEPAF